MERPKLIPGINNISNADYHKDSNYLSSSSLKLLLKDPAKFYKEKILGEREDKVIPAFLEGSYVHALILEPEVISKEFAFYEGWRKAGPGYAAFEEANQDKIILSKPQTVRCENYFKAYTSRPEAVALIEGGEAEHTICGELAGVPIKVRCDYINVEKGYIADVKTSGFPVDLDSFAQTIDQYYYQLSAALYCQMAKQHYEKDFDFYFIAISKKEETCEVFKISEKTMTRGQQMVSHALKKYKQCKASGIWKSSQPEIETDGDYEILEI